MRQNFSFSRWLSCAVLMLASLGGCSAEPGFPGGDNRTVVISGRGTTVVDNPSGNDCLIVPGGACVKPQQQCGAGAHAEVIVSADGKVQYVACYPDQPPPYTVVDTQGSASVDNKGLLVLDGAADGVDITGNLDVSGNNAIVYGQGPGASVIGGNVTVSKNNGTVRGVTVLGDTSIIGNNTVMYYCVIVGNVTIYSNDNILSACDIFGDVTVIGNNNQLLDLRVQGQIKNSGNNNVCSADFRFADVNHDLIIDPLEVGLALSCK